jgi:polyisoprenyl-teichoic acid--peptidoglycan teichoic acid transferase
MFDRLVPILSDRRGMSRIGWVVVMLLVMCVSAGIGMFLGVHFPGINLGLGITHVFQPPFEGKKTVYILTLGEDDTGIRHQKTKVHGLSDTIMLVSIDMETKRVAALSIPRDTRIDLDGYGGQCKINASHVRGGPMLTCLAVERLVGIRPDYYIKTNLEGFRKCVDILGGVEIDVEKNMHYTDTWGGLYIDLKKGRQLLNGEKAMQYVRFRHDAMGDITRIERQQKFLKVLAKKAVSPGNLPRLPRIMSALMTNVETNLTLKDLIFMAELAKETDMSQVKTATLPGAPQMIGGASYWIANAEETAKIVQELFYPPLPSLPKVEVLNGSGIAGSAQKVAEELQHRGYEVVSVGNADSFDYASSEVISRKTDPQMAKQIAGIINTSVIRQESSEDARPGVTVIVGKDCQLAAKSYN